jgi:hypothetical protein
MLIAWKATKCDSSIASFRYRVQAPQAALQRRGHKSELFDPARQGRYDMVVFSKSYGPADHEIAAALKAAGKRVTLDICDNHFYNPFDLPRYRQARNDLLKMIGLCDQVICSTPALAEIVTREANLRTSPLVIGDMAELIDVPGHHEQERRNASDRASLLWFGSHGSPNAPSGMSDLLLVAPHLHAAAAIRPFELVVASNSNKKFAALASQLPVPTRYVEWSQETFPQILARTDAVIIPLSHNPFVACKTHNRITTALGAGIPVVADSIESYREFESFCFLDDWRNGLSAVLDDAGTARRRARAARPYIEAKWSIDRLAPLWEEALGLGRPAIAAPSLAPSLAPSPAPSLAPALSTRRYQGGLDGAQPDRITGWVRMPSQPSLTVGVDLKCDGQIVASVLADRPRGDLKAAGFAQSACGFEIAIPVSLCDGALRAMEVVANGSWTIGTREARFVHAAFPEPIPEIRAVPALPRLEPVMIEAVASAVSLCEVPLASLRNAIQQEGDVRLQQLLVGELEELCKAVETVRRVAARIVVFAGDANLATARSENPAKPRELKPARVARLAIKESLEWTDVTQRPN